MAIKLVKILYNENNFNVNFRASEGGSCSAEVENISIEISSFDLSVHQRIGIYGGIVGGAAAIVMFRAILTYLICLAAARILHNKMFRSILRVPMLFFDINPVGMKSEYNLYLHIKSN